MSNAFYPTREEIGDPFAAMERVRQLRAKMFPQRVQNVVIPIINKPKENPTPEPVSRPAEPIVRDILHIESKADLLWPPMHEPEKMTAAKIIREVALEYGLTPNDIKSQRRDAYVIEARFKAIWRMRKETLMSLPQMGRQLGDRDHSSCLHAVRQYEARMRDGSHEKQLRMYGPVSSAKLVGVKP
jgi:hypothetical protein